MSLENVVLFPDLFSFLVCTVHFCLWDYPTPTIVRKFARGSLYQYLMDEAEAGAPTETHPHHTVLQITAVSL